MTAGSARGGVRRRIAGGTIVNAAFLVVVNGLALLRGFAVAAFLSTGEYGLWGAVTIVMLTISWLRDAGISDRYIQQDEADQELAFQRALTLDLMVSAACLAAGLVLVPLLALALGVPALVAPALVMSLTLPLAALQSPLWIHARRLDFVRQRRLQALDPIAAFVVTIALAAAGAGVWALVAGTVAGAAVGAVAAVRSSPYRIALRFDRAVARGYVSFSWPLLFGSGLAVFMGQTSLFAAEATVGLAGLGALTLASSVAQFAARADQAVSEALYPAVARVKERRDLLLEAFAKSNRLALMWGLPFGVGVALFAADLVEFVLGEKWLLAVGVLQAAGAVSAIHQIGFNWDVFYRAAGRTRPIAVGAVIGALAFVALPIPLLIAEGLRGAAWGLVGAELVSLAVRWVMLKRFFPGLRMAAHVARAVAPSVVPVAAVLALRAIDGPVRSAGDAALELGVYAVLTAVATAMLERSLLREVAGYLSRRAAPSPG